MSARSIAFTVTGRVQGVGFRDFTQRSAQRHGVSGWVANGREDVQGEAHGESAAIDAFVKDLHRGPSMSQVSDVKLSRDEPAEAKRGGDFEVRASIR